MLHGSTFLPKSQYPIISPPPFRRRVTPEGIDLRGASPQSTPLSEVQGCRPIFIIFFLSFSDGPKRPKNIALSTLSCGVERPPIAAALYLSGSRHLGYILAHVILGLPPFARFVPSGRSAHMPASSTPPAANKIQHWTNAKPPPPTPDGGIVRRPAEQNPRFRGGQTWPICPWMD